MHEAKRGYGTTPPSAGFNTIGPALDRVYDRMRLPVTSLSRPVPLLCREPVGHDPKQPQEAEAEVSPGETAPGLPDLDADALKALSFNELKQVGTQVFNGPLKPETPSEVPEEGVQSDMANHRRSD
jgi:hypothetical protein